jgi:putative DNA primase/helicase
MSEAWRAHLIKNKQGNLLPCLNNIALILSHQSEWRQVLAYDAFAGTVVKRRQPPWPKDVCPDDDALGDWTAEDSSRTAVTLARDWVIAAPTHMVAEAVEIVARLWVVHPLRECFNELPKWDHKYRLDTHLIRCAGAPDNVYVRAVTKNFFIAACARVWLPGCKVDTMLVLEGPQGVGKSTWFRIAASMGRTGSKADEWFLETSIEIGSKDGYQALRRKFIAEISELDSLNRAEVSRVKAFMTASKDTYRPSYGRAPVDFLRQIVFGGTVNPDGAGYMKDVTGGRRFNPVLILRVDTKMVRAEIEQIWAEALYRYRRNESWHLKEPRVLKAAAEEAEERRQPDPWEDDIRDCLLNNEALVRKGVTTRFLLEEAIEKPKDRRERADQIRVGQALRALGWTDVRRGADGIRRYLPPEPDAWWRQYGRRKRK